MKRYKLLKDLPGLKKGTILSEGKSIFGARTLITKNDVGHIFISNNLSGMLRDYNAWRTGRVFRTKGECEKALDRELAEVRLRKTSDFEPDFENGEGGYVVSYDYINKKLDCSDSFWNDSGEPVRYATKEDALKSIKENRADWLKYLGIKEEE